ncbi:hypothetical protein DRW07_00920 [Alteromonas sediminis]|uniref:Uncharacterized protein n=1 Tax=Alteromonas sediminis TaxID=2259342 RepID=A0A3N5Y2C7_9ALTE|nr:hypothetical protein [Alteromonas sediminis]RPJ68007.1 hypothetical protein DRW07_00920 [Alteromonas sediminis]
MKNAQRLKPLVSFFAVGITLGAIHMNVYAHGKDVSDMFDDVHIEDGRSVGELSALNSDIELGDSVTAASISTVNGDITMGYGVRIQSISAVNGDIEAKSDLFVEHSISTVNGDIQFSDGAEVGRDIETVNGDISLAQVIVGDDIGTVNGDISLADATRVSGDIVFEKSNSDNDWSDSNSPKLTIDSDVTVDGSIILYRKVKLDVPDHLLDKVEYRYQQ